MADYGSIEDYGQGGQQQGQDNRGMDLWSMLKGFKNPLASGDPAAINPNYGVPNGQVDNARMGALGRMGMTMIAAGMPQSPDQRARIMAGLGADSQITPQLNEQQQMMLRNTQLQAAQRSMLQAKARDAAIKDPRILSQLGVTPEMAAALGTDNLDKIMVALYSRDPIAAAQAKALIDHYKAEDAKLGLETQQKTADLENQKRLGGMLFPDAAGGAAATSAPGTTAPAMAPNPRINGAFNALPPAQTQPVAAGNMSAAQQMLTRQLPQMGQPAPIAGQNPGNVFGGTSAVRPMIRGAQSALGVNISPNGAAEENATAAIQVLNNKLTGVLSRDMEGRQTTWAQKLARSPLPEPNSFTVGPDRAAERYSAVLGDIKSELELANRSAQYAFLMKDNGKLQAALTRKADLESVAQDVTGVIGGLKANLKGQPSAEHPAAAELRRRGLDPTKYMQ